MWNFRRGSLLSAIIFVYAICTPFNGYFGGGMYSRVGGRNWIKQIVVGALLFPCIISIVALSVNSIAIYYHAARAIPFTTMLAILCICVFVILPLRYFIFTSFWAHKIYYVYGFMLLVACILIVVTACVTIVATYFLLNAEDYRWRMSRQACYHKI